jgi:hypothetical protein
VDTEWPTRRGFISRFGRVFAASGVQHPKQYLKVEAVWIQTARQDRATARAIKLSEPQNLRADLLPGTDGSSAQFQKWRHRASLGLDLLNSTQSDA